MVAGTRGPTVTESTAKPTQLVEEEEKRRGGEEEKNLASSSAILSSEPLEEDDDDEEVSWQSAARASLEKKSVTAKPSSPPKKAEATPLKAVVKTQDATPQTTNTPTNNGTVHTQTPPLLSPAPNSAVDLPLTEAQFTQEELPADFWSHEPEPPPTRSYDDEAFETATSAPSQNGVARGSKPVAKLPFEMPLFNELQALFPGRIIRIDAKAQKQVEESEESTTTNEAVNVVESEEGE